MDKITPEELEMVITSNIFDSEKIITYLKVFGKQCFEAGIKEGIKHERKNRLNISPFNYNYTSFEDYLKEIENEK